MPDPPGGVFVLRFPSAGKTVSWGPGTRTGYLREHKDAVYENLRDLNFGYKDSKLPDVDYGSLKSSLQDEAATLLAEITRLENSFTRGTRNTRS